MTKSGPPQRRHGLGQAAGLAPGAQLVLERAALGRLPAVEAQLAHAQQRRAQRQRPRLVAARRRQPLRAVLLSNDQ